jgi:cellulose synthase (UDP-forming)
MSEQKRADAMHAEITETSRRTPALTVAAYVLGVALLGLAASIRLDWKDQLVLGATLFVGAIWLNRRSSGHTVTLALSILSIFCTLRYGYWRVSATYAHVRANSIGELGWDLIFVLLLLAAEGYAILILILGYFQTARPLKRKPIALPDDVQSWPTVDIFVPTYNEPIDVVRSTVLAALNLDYPAGRYKVYILDDGRRPEFQAFAEACGAGYITRHDNNHAKAGNINHALARTSAEYVAIFDCDHIPTRSFLQISTGWFLREERLGMVQTPHHFYSADPFERNLGIFRSVPNEGALFYGMVQDGNDFWNATFFCGSCALLRRTALDEIDGVAVETVTEDAHTALKMQRRAWNTAYLSVPQAGGLATTTLSEHIQQRIRWARGMVQILRLECPLFAGGLSLPQRLCYFNSVVHFLYAFPRLIFLTAPLVYLLFGRSNLYGDVITILAYALPHLAMATFTNSRVQGKFRHSFWNEVYETVLAPYILIPTTLALINPRWGKFNVTPKSGRVMEAYFDWRIAAPFLLLVLLNFIGIGLGLSHLMNEPEKLGTIAVNVFWAACNTLTLGAALAAAYETRQLRASPRVKMLLPAQVLLPDGLSIPGEILDMSNGGLAFRFNGSSDLAVGDMLRVVVSLSDEDCVFPARVVANGKSTLRFAFAPLSLAEQETLARLIYSRADAWIHWSDSNRVDRPFRSLLDISRLSLRGLALVFRELVKRDQPAAAEAPRRQQPVYPMVIIGGILLLLFALRGTAAAPAPKIAQPPAALFEDSVELRAAGQKQPLILRGTDGRASFLFGVPLTKVVKASSLRLAYRLAPGLRGGASQMLVTLNGSPVVSVPLAHDSAAQSMMESEISLPADLLMSENTLLFQLAGRCEGACPSGADAEFKTYIDITSKIQLSGSMLPLMNELRLLPAPFFYAAMQRAIDLPFVFPEQPDLTTLEAAGMTASWFGIRADHRGIRFPASIGQIPPGNIVMFARRGSALLVNFKLPSVTGPAVAVRDNPTDAFGKVLLILGDNTQQVLAAARALSLGRLPASGDYATVNDVEMPPVSKHYDAPRWLKTDRSVSFGDQMRPEQLRVEGTGAVKLYFRLPPDLHFGSQATVPLRLNYRYAGLPKGAKAVVTVKLNGFTVGTRRLGGIQSAEVQRDTIYVPVPTLYPRNTLTVDFSYERANTSTGTETPAGLVLRDSELDLRGISNFTQMPKLELFAKAGYPFTRLADLSGTAVILPPIPTSEEIGLYLGVLGFLGAQTGAPAVRLTVMDPDHSHSLRDKELLVIGGVEDQTLFKRWSDYMPVRLDVTDMRLNELTITNPVDAIASKLWGTRARERRKLQDLLATDSPEAMIQAFGSPMNADRTVIAMVSASPRNVDPLILMLEQAQNSEDVFGSVSVYQAGHFQSFRPVREAYVVGRLEWRDAVDYWAARYLWLVPLAILALIYLLAGRLKGWLDRRAELRLGFRV